MIIEMTAPAEVSRTGGKAAALMRMVGHGFNVPSFATLPPEAFVSGKWTPKAEVSLTSTLKKLGEGPFAVRSSAIDEDGAEHSHAGQFLSLLNVEKEEVPAACIKVYESARDANVANYRAARGMEGHAGGTAVLVQQMVAARAAGVAFTADPVSGRRGRVVISAVGGLGDRLVSGEEDGDTYILNGAEGLESSTVEGGVLTRSDLSALYDLAISIEKVCGCPQDIEWAFEGEQLFLLQTRPITTPLLPEPIPDSTLSILDNSNIVESYPGIVTPLTFSFAQYAYARVYRSFVKLLGVSDQVISENAPVFENMLTRIDGRVYYNLANWYRALALLPGFSLNRSYMETMMGVSEPLPAEIVDSISPPKPRGVALMQEWFRVAGSVCRLLFEAVRLKSTRNGFYDRLNAALHEPADVLSEMPLTELAREYRRIESDLLDRWDAPIVNDFICMMSFGSSRKLLEKWAGPEGLEVHNDIMIGQGDIISAEPARRIRRMGAILEKFPELQQQLAQGDGSRLEDYPELSCEVTAYLDRFSDRCAEELKLESVTLDRDPTPLFRAIAAGAGQNKSSEIKNSDTLRALFSRKPVKSWIARMVMALAKARVRDRENLRFERTRIFGRARHLFRAVGVQFVANDMIESAGDIYLLTVHEILGAIEGYSVTQNLRTLCDARRKELEVAQKRSDPDERLQLRGAVFASLKNIVRHTQKPDDSTIEREGTGCSAGVVTATARVIKDPRTEALQKGEILVARHTDPGWIAVFANASAIVVERGSLLSHSAIVARELGIPCVVGLKNAMRWIKDGQTVEVDGGTGIVRKKQ